MWQSSTSESVLYLGDWSLQAPLLDAPPKPELVCPVRTSGLGNRNTTYGLLGMSRYTAEGLPNSQGGWHVQVPPAKRDCTVLFSTSAGDRHLGQPCSEQVQIPLPRCAFMTRETHLLKVASDDLQGDLCVRSSIQ